MIKSMDVTELKERIEGGDDYILVDCREINEWNEGHIPTALFIPLSEFQAEWKKHLTDADKNKEIILQCRSGRRSLSAAQILLSEGFENLNNLDGGILDWQDRGYKIVD